MKHPQRFSVAAVAVFMAITVFSARGAAQVDEDPRFGDLVMAVSKFDFTNGRIGMYWPDEVWLSLAYMEKSGDGLMGQAIMRVLNKESLVFTLAPMDENPLPSVVKATLEGHDGTRTSMIRVHDSFRGMFPELFVFPGKDAIGNSVIGPDGAADLKLSLEFEGGETTEFTWNLPITFPAVARDAVAWLDETMKKPEAEMTEFELIAKYLTPKMQIDVESGLIVAHFLPELAGPLVEKMYSYKADTKELAAVRMIFNNYTIFLLLTMEGKKNERITAIAKEARAITADGKTLLPDKDGMTILAQDLQSSVGEPKTDFGEFVVFQNLGAGAVKLILPDSAEKNTVTFEWDF